MAFVGTVVPDEPAYHNTAFSRAGNMYQRNLLHAMEEAGLPASIALSQCPQRAFPMSRVLRFPGASDVLDSGLRVHLVPFLNLPFLRPLTVGIAVLISLIRWARQHRNVPSKIVYSFNLTEPPGLFTWVAARFVRAKFVASVADINVPGETVPATLARHLDYWLQKTLISQLDGLVVVSRRIVEDLAPNARYIRIEGGMDQRALEQLCGSTSRERLANVPFTIVSAGSLTDINGIVELVHAFSLLRGDGYRLRIAGVGPLQSQVQAAAAADARIEYCGYLSLDQVFALYQSADLLVNMRLTQAAKTDYFFPSKVIEMLASGVPVVTTCTGHIEEEYAGIAFLLREETPEALAAMIQRVASMDPGARAERGQAAQAYIKTHNTWEEQGRRVVEFVRRDVLSPSRPTEPQGSSDGVATT